MKITDIKTFVVDCYRTNWVFVKIYTDEGISGIGEATLEYKENAVCGAVRDLERYLTGKNPLDIEAHYHNIYRDAYWRGGAVLMSALSAVETALWDINARALNVPVYRLLGGKVRDRVKIYVNGWFAGAREPGEFAEHAEKTIKKGIKALKWDPFGDAYMNIENAKLDKALKNIAAVREAVGFDIDLLIEGHGRFNVPTAIKIAKEIEPFKPVFFEEPVPPDDLDALAYVRDKSPVSIAAGERLYTRRAFKELFEKRAADYIQPDISHAGGIMELRKIAAMAEAYYLSFAPHNPSGPVASAAALQLAACTPNFEILEIMATDVPWRKSITNEKLIYNDGYIEIPDKPGLGIKLTEDEAKKHPYQPHDLRHYTGRLTDIRTTDSIEYF
jgi:galactonate dehydratase